MEGSRHPLPPFQSKSEIGIPPSPLVRKKIRNRLPPPLVRNKILMYQFKKKRKYPFKEDVCIYANYLSVTYFHMAKTIDLHFRLRGAIQVVEEENESISKQVTTML